MAANLSLSLDLQKYLNCSEVCRVVYIGWKKLEQASTGKENLMWSAVMFSY
jgi:hypothetical protein